MKCSHTGHFLPHKLTEWIGCHDNHESKLPYLTKDPFEGIVTGCSSEEDLGPPAGY